MSDKTSLVVIGGGPGGYAAAFLAADLGLETTLIDLEANPGGVCLYRGCIPSKALLHAAKVLTEARDAHEFGVTFDPPRVDVAKLRQWKSGVVGKMTGGLGQLTKQRKITYIQGRARFTSAHNLTIETSDGGTQSLDFEHAVLATGSSPAVIPSLSIDSPRVMNSTGALELENIPARLLVIGGGYIGLELGTAYSAIGSEVTVVEATDTLLPGADRDLVKILEKRLQREFSAILMKTKVVKLEDTGSEVKALFEDEYQLKEQTFDKVLIAVGRTPNSRDLGLENTGIELDRRGFVPVNEQRQTVEPSIYAIGDIAGEPMLAHKASHEGRVAVEVIAGHNVAFEPRAIPAVVFTDPEIAWAGLTENAAKAEGRTIKVAKFPWGASGRAATLDRADGVTKLLIDPETEQVLGVGIAGPGAGELIAEGVLAIEMAALATDVKLSIHPHPTLSETVMESAEIYFGQATHYATRR